MGDLKGDNKPTESGFYALYPSARYMKLPSSSSAPKEAEQPEAKPAPVEARQDVSGTVESGLIAPRAEAEVSGEENDIVKALRDSLSPDVSDEFLKKFQEKFPIEMERMSFSIPADFQSFDNKERYDTVFAKLNALVDGVAAGERKKEEMLQMMKDFGGVFKLLADAGKINKENVSKFWSVALTRVMLAKASVEFKYKDASATLKEKYNNLKYSLALTTTAPYFTFKMGDGSLAGDAEAAKFDTEYKAEKAALAAAPVAGAAVPAEGVEGQAKAPVQSTLEEQAKIDALKNTMIGGILSKWFAFDEMDPETGLTGFQKLFQKKDWFTSFILGLLSMAGFEGLEEFRGDVDDIFGVAGEKGKEALSFVTEGVAGLAGGVLALEGLRALSKNGKAVEDEIKTSEDIKLEEKKYVSMTITIPEGVDGAKVVFPEGRSDETYKIFKDEVDKGQMTSLSEAGTYTLTGTIPAETVFGKGVLVKLNEKPVVAAETSETPAA